MSNLPPPTSGGAPYQPEQPTVAFNPLPPINDPASAPKKSSKGKLIGIIVAAVVVVAGLVVGGILVFGGGDDEGNVNATKASGAVEDTTVAAKLDRTTNLAVLAECPFDGLDDLADDAPKDFDAKEAAGGDDQAAITQTDQREDPLLLQCITTTDDGALTYGVTAAAVPPTELQDYISRTLTEATADFEATSSFRGGTLLPFCTTPDNADNPPLCATAWYDKQLMTAIFASGDGATTDVTTEWIKKSLDDVITDLEGSDPGKVEVSQTREFPIDSAAASTNLNELVAAAAIGDAGTSANQDSCLVADFATLQGGVPAGLDPSTLSGEPFFALTRPSDEGDPALMVCADTSDDSANQVGLLVAQVAPPDFEDYVKRLIQSDDVTFEDTVDFRGGTLHPYCVNDSDGNLAFCETDWLSDDLQVGVFLAFDGVTTADTTTLLQANIDSIVATTAAADASQVKTPS